MSGTEQGGLKCAKKIKEKYGADFYSRIGRKGGKNGHTGGFASLEVGSDGLTGYERARIAGRKGGSMPKHRKKKKEPKFIEY